MPWFTPKPIIDEHQLNWQLETYSWLLRHYGQRFNNGTYQLIKPTKKDFPEECFSEDEVFINTFIRVKQYAGVLDWPCKLEPQAQDVKTQLAPTITIKNAPQGPGGTFSYRDYEGAVITYNPDLVNDIEGLVSTYAHELGHYLTADCDEPPPGGWDLWEPATDLTAVYMGFGIFMANSSFVFKQFSSFDSQGWSSQRRGYLSPEELVNALAIFTLLKGIETKESITHLKPNLRSLLKKSIKYYRQSDFLDDLRPK